MFVWNEELYGVRPVEGQNGSFMGLATRLAPCDCPAPQSVYVDTGEMCLEQSTAFHAEYNGYDNSDDYVRDLLAADELANKLEQGFGDIADLAAYTNELEALLPAGYTVRVIGLDELMELGFSPAELGMIAPSNQPPDWLTGLADDFISQTLPPEDEPPTE